MHSKKKKENQTKRPGTFFLAFLPAGSSLMFSSYLQSRIQGFLGYVGIRRVPVGNARLVVDGNATVNDPYTGITFIISTSTTTHDFDRKSSYSYDFVILVNLFVFRSWWLHNCIHRGNYSRGIACKTHAMNHDVQVIYTFPY